MYTNIKDILKKTLEEKIIKMDSFDFFKILSKDYEGESDCFYEFAKNPYNKPYIEANYNLIVNELGLNDTDLNIEIKRIRMLKSKGEVCTWLFYLVAYTFIRFIYDFNDNTFDDYTLDDMGDIKRLKPDYKDKEINVDYIKDIIKEDPNYIRYYRGQSDFKWNIVPSILRSLKELKESVVVNKNECLHVLSSFIEKYKKLINYNKHSIDYYDLYAFAQHSIECSPLVDITTNLWIATSFALSNSKNKVDFENKPSAIYELKIDKNSKYYQRRVFNVENRRSVKMEETGITFLNTDTICLGKTYKAKVVDCDGKKMTDSIITFDTFFKTLQKLRPDFYIFDYRSNDRMVYQQGCFIYFYGRDTVSLNGRIFYELNKAFEYSKYIIKPENKRTILDEIYKNHREYDLYHLMNPYEIFKE